MKKKLKLLFVLAILFGKNCFSQSRGEKLFKENNPKDAVQVLENEILNNQISDDAYNFLGLGYYQLGEYEKSANAFERGIKAGAPNAKILFFNQGNSYFALKKFEKATESFGNSYKLDGEFYDALLNRANSYLMNDKLALAKKDYEEYLKKNPEAAQKNEIEKLILAIDEEIERRKEAQKILEEQNRAKWEIIDPSITENSGENDVVWEKINAAIEEEPQEAAAENEQSENLDADDAKNAAESYEWQEISQKEIEEENKIGEEKPENGGDKKAETEKLWQKVENDVLQNEIAKPEKDLWEKIPGEDNFELEKLNAQSQKEFEQRRKATQEAAENLLRE